MTGPVIVRQATAADSELVADMVFELIGELVAPDDGGLDPGVFRQTSARLLGPEDRYWALLAETPDGECLGVITLNECASIYAGGPFGEIPELYVEPRQRSRGIAAQLIKAALDFARERDWMRLEVGAPPLPDWRRSYEFYLKQGFVEVGPRLKILL